MENTKNATLRTLMASLIADIDIFLLRDKKQEKDNDKKCFTHAEIRAQLKTSMLKIGNVVENLGLNIDQELNR